jgi:hypothetical protein
LTGIVRTSFLLSCHSAIPLSGAPDYNRNFSKKKPRRMEVFIMLNMLFAKGMRAEAYPLPEPFSAIAAAQGDLAETDIIRRRIAAELIAFAADSIAVFVGYRPFTAHFLLAKTVAGQQMDENPSCQQDHGHEKSGRYRNQQCLHISIRLM